MPSEFSFRQHEEELLGRDRAKLTRKYEILVAKWYQYECTNYTLSNQNIIIVYRVDKICITLCIYYKHPITLKS